MHFTEMHGLCNKYLCYYGELQNPELVFRTYADGHFGIGSDGIIVISPSLSADFKMRLYNAGGSQAVMCGNEIRCAAKFLFDKGYTDKKKLTLETPSGNQSLALQTRGGTVAGVTVHMGKCADGPVALETCCGRVTVAPAPGKNLHAVSIVSDVGAVYTAQCEQETEITVCLHGGSLKIKVLPDGTVLLTGPAKTICECEIDDF